MESLKLSAEVVHRHRASEKVLVTAFCNDLRAQCERLTATGVADTLGISQQYLSDILNGRRNVSDHLIQKVMEL